EHASALFGVAPPNTFGEATSLLALAEAAAGMPACDRRAFCNPVWGCVEDVSEIVERGERFSKLQTAFDSAFVESAWAASFEVCRATLAEKGHSWLRIFSSHYRAHVSHLRAYLKVPLPKTAEQRVLLVDGLIAAQRARRSFEELQDSGQAAFGADWRKDRSNWPKLKGLTSWWSTVSKDGFPDDVRE